MAQNVVTSEKARQVLGDKAIDMSDTDIENILATLRFVSDKMIDLAIQKNHPE